MSAQKHTPRVTTTHGTWGSGEPHLRIRHHDHHLLVALSVEEMRIGSGPEVDLMLSSARPLHAVIRHDVRDEYVLTMYGEGAMSAVAPDADDRSLVLRTGANFTINGWQFVFAREESSDHGRPYAGRQGGEGSHQRRQAPRPDYHEQAGFSGEMLHCTGGPIVLREHPELGGRLGGSLAGVDVSIGRRSGRL